MVHVRGYVTPHCLEVTSFRTVPSSSQVLEDKESTYITRKYQIP